MLETPHGRLRAAEVVLATNAWAAGLPLLKGKLTNFGSYVVLTEPVPELLAQIGWTGGESISDGRMFLHYFRTTNDGRVVMGSGSGPIGHGGRVDRRFFGDAATAARAELGLRKLLPGLADANVTHAWGGPIDVSPDHLPFFGTVAGRRIHYGVGYSGSGVGASWLGGQILASLVTGPLGRVDKPRARLEKGAGAAARADQAARRGARARCDSHAGGARGGRPSRAALRARRGRAAPADRHEDRHALEPRRTCSARPADMGHTSPLTNSG